MQTKHLETIRLTNAKLPFADPIWLVPLTEEEEAWDRLVDSVHRGNAAAGVA